MRDQDRIAILEAHAAALSKRIDEIARRQAAVEDWIAPAPVERSSDQHEHRPRAGLVFQRDEPVYCHVCNEPIRQVENAPPLTFELIKPRPEVSD